MSNERDLIPFSLPQLVDGRAAPRYLGRGRIRSVSTHTDFAQRPLSHSVVETDYGNAEWGGMGLWTNGQDRYQTIAFGIADNWYCGVQDRQIARAGENMVYVFGPFADPESALEGGRKLYTESSAT